MDGCGKRHFNINYSTYLERRCHIDIRAFIVKEFLSEFDRSNIIDLGCGDGSISLQFLPESKKITLVDFSKHMLEACKAKVPSAYLDRVEFIDSNIECFMPSHKYDVVLLLGVLAHANNGYPILKKVCECLKPGGVCIIQITDSAKLLSKILYAYAKLKRVICPYEFDYPLKKMSFSEVHLVAESMGLALLRNARYFIPPFIHHLLDEDIGTRCGLAILENKYMSHFGSEVVLMYRS